ncbi:unnamed protein product [Ectocarpus sp. CCAP 1310/34]|nr:unnamed protein product [Ectocarpus sp. CCAP 1310/34]
MQAQQLQDALESTALFVLGSAPMSFLVDSFNAFLELLGAPVPPTDAEQLATWIAATMSTLASYYILFGQRHKRRREHLYTELRRAQLQVARLEEKLLEAEGEEDSDKGGREVRIWMDGAFDMMHYGHMNAFRQGKALGTHLVVGVNSDESIAKCKGPPVMNDQERLTAVEGCKFVDEVVPGVPYVMSPEYLEYVIDKYRIDFVVHGDDPCIVDGKDVYEAAKARGKYRSIPRTEGVSTTDIVGRMLLQSRSHHSLRGGEQEIPRLASFNRRREPTQVRSKFLTTSWMLRLFSAGVQAPPKGARVVYIDGETATIAFICETCCVVRVITASNSIRNPLAPLKDHSSAGIPSRRLGAWDMFHAGHVAILKQARDFGDYLIAGVHSDEVVNAQRGLNMPIMNLNERVLSVLGCAYVNDVLIDAPLRMTREMIASLNISAAVHGTVDDNMAVHATGDEGGQGQEATKFSPYEVPKDMGIFHEIKRQVDSSTLTVMEIVGRIEANQELFQRKYAKKMAAEDEYYKNRYKLTPKDATSASS